MSIDSSVADHRSFFAEFIVQSVGSSDARLISAFSSTEREKYVGPGPWRVFVNSNYIVTPSDDPRFLYQDIVVALAADRGINNGQPTLHTRCLAACSVQSGESVVHIGAGTGYYTAVLAALAGRDGSVTGYEVELDLATRALETLASYPNVLIRAESAAECVLPKADVIYVNAGATHPLASWLDALNIGGRLAFPLTPNEGFGVMLLVTRRGPDVYAASVIAPVAFVPCAGARDEASSAAIIQAMRTRTIMGTRSLQRGTTPDQTACCVGSGWWLSSAEVA